VLPEDEIEAWIGEQVQPTAAIELALARPWGTVLRVPIVGGVAWFKACAPVQSFEPRLTAALSERRPDLLPEVIAHDEERAWLLLADAGEPLGIGGDPAPWLDLLPRYAELQHAEAVHTDRHLAAGVPDRRLARFPTLYEEMLSHASSLGSEDLARLRAFTKRFGELCAELDARGIPATIQHDDLHGANVYRRDADLRILDWGDSCISHPFRTLYVTFEHLFLPRDDPWLGRLRDAYLEPWGRPAELRGTYALVERLGPFGHVFKSLPLLDTIPKAEQALYLSDLAPTLAACAAAAG
jgi:hypothetical protein